MGDNSEDFGGTDPLCFLMDNNQASSEASLDSTTCGRSSHWAFENECSNNSFLSSSVTLKSHKNESISVNDDNFDIDNVAPDSLVMGEHDSCWLNSLSELQCETIMSTRMEMIRDEFLMRKALQQASFSDEAVELECKVGTPMSTQPEVMEPSFIEKATTLTTQPELTQRSSIDKQSTLFELATALSTLDPLMQPTLFGSATALNTQPALMEPNPAQGRGRGRPPG
jgi:hypothetical protein